ncbi:Glyoxalase ElbB [BD1-7 clade bacterium]|uniref:Glyoxalase ElbB n=1 Tax=BD1-7 clade bacterium TaxID=2029982 RepID=A0A5S9QVY2_9GAMM|nr:Glyoxalase ElbB [BD1-7 clade bacterium]CAA0122761.1 Glyoxalase ElbB [BD1-7 clade bacterium]
MKKIGVLLSGCGVYDGSEVQEAVSVLIALDKLGAEAICIAPDIDQHHVVNHTTGEEMPETRNVLVESARICRGDIRIASSVSIDEVDGLAMPGGFGAAKNLSTWALEGPDGIIDPSVRQIIRDTHAAGKPIAALCVSPVVVAKAFEGTSVKPSLTLGTDAEPTEYDINGFHAGIESVGSESASCSLASLHVDEENRIISTPCYMQTASVGQIYDAAYLACAKLLSLAES